MILGSINQMNECALHPRPLHAFARSFIELFVYVCARSEEKKLAIERGAPTLSLCARAILSHSN
jgi:hypothetical protein